MSDQGGEDGFSARERRRQRRAGREPRRRAVREAAVKAHTTLRPEAIRPALIHEMAQRDIPDPTPEELDFLEEAMTSPRRAAARQIFRQARLIRDAVRVFREEMTYAQPRWALIPNNVPSVPDPGSYRTLGRWHQTLRADADLLGATADTAHLDLFMPTPIDK